MGPIKDYGSNKSLWVQILGQIFMGPIKINTTFRKKFFQFLSRFGRGGAMHWRRNAKIKPQRRKICGIIAVGQP